MLKPLSQRAKRRFTHTHWQSRDGTPVYIRPVKLSDKTALRSFFRRIDPEDMRLKFFGATNIDENAITRLMITDPGTMTFMATRSDTGEILGFAKWKKILDAAEFAILVRSDLQKHGFGWLLMQVIIQYSVFRAIREIRGDVFAYNVDMLAMCRELGFVVSRSPRDPQCLKVNLDLQQPFLA